MQTIRMNPTTEELRRAVLALQIAGGQNGVIALTPGSTTTEVAFFGIGPASVVALIPTNAASAGAMATTWVEPTDNSFVIRHANTAVVDRTFRYLVTL